MKITSTCVLALGLAMLAPVDAHAAMRGAVLFHAPGEPWPESHRVAASCSLSYNGGQVLSNPQAVPVFWGASVNASLKSWASGYMQELLNSPYQDALSEYSTSAQGTMQKIGRGTATMGYTITPSVTGSSIQDAQIGPELLAQIAAGHLPMPTYDSQMYINTLYVVFFPPGTTITDPTGAQSCANGGFCGYHSSVAYSTGTGGIVPYAVIPDFSGACSQGCQVCASGDANCDGSEPATAATTLSHEMSEACTDTDVSQNGSLGAAWYAQQSNCGEIGDICAASTATQVDTSEVPGVTPTIIAQSEWSNMQGKCEMSNPTIGPQPGGSSSSSSSSSSSGSSSGGTSSSSGSSSGGGAGSSSGSGGSSGGGTGSSSGGGTGSSSGGGTGSSSGTSSSSGGNSSNSSGSGSGGTGSSSGGTGSSSGAANVDAGSSGGDSDAGNFDSLTGKSGGCSLTTAGSEEGTSALGLTGLMLGLAGLARVRSRRSR